MFLESFQFACKNYKGNTNEADIAKAMGFESNDEYNEIMFLCGSDKTSKGENSSSVTISISGSTSVGPLIESIQEVYEAKNNNVILEIQQNGSGAGIKDVMGGVSQIGMSSRDLKGEEKDSV